MNEVDEWKRDTWCQYLPALHRQLAAPDLECGLPRSFVSLNFEQTCAWWETLRYLFRNLLGWRCIPAGLAWWYEAGKPNLEDPRLKLILDRWNTREELDYFAAREWKSCGYSGTGCEEQIWRVKDYELEKGWWRRMDDRSKCLTEHNPYHGGSNALHLSHSDQLGYGRPTKSPLMHHDKLSRRAVIVVNAFGSWQHDLKEAEDTLPDLGDRSWRMEVFDREVGYLGTFRRSRVTGLWFQGKHSIHMAGNVVEN
ncbi:MAG: hypothetical protein ACSHX9_08040 [Luteolibacter sp.]